MAADISGIDALFNQATPRYNRGDVRNLESYFSLTPPRECEHCKQEFKPKRHDRLRFCSRECGYAQRRAEAKPSDLWAKGARRSRVFFPECRDCSSIFTARSVAQRCQPCRSTVVRPPRSKVLSSTCRACGVAFEQVTKDGRPTTFCSKVCRLDGKRTVQRIAKLMRAARERAQFVEAVDPFKVFDRDRWQCQECGVKTPRKLRGTYDDRAPELDHIVPLSKGGEHSYRNTQCLCRACNGAKSDTIRGQMRLFG